MNFSCRVFFSTIHCRYAKKKISIRYRNNTLTRSNFKTRLSQVFPTTTAEEREEFRKVAKRQWTMLVHGWVKSTPLQFEYFDRVKENIDPDEHVRFHATVMSLRAGSFEDKKFESEAFKFEPFVN